MKHLLCIFFCLITIPLFAQQLTITVAQNGSGNFRTIQEAVNSVRDLSQKQVRIYIKNGIYPEKLVIPSWKTHISLIGESKEHTIITGNDFSGKPFPGGKDPYGNTKFSTYTSCTVLVQGNYFTAENLTIQNTAGRVGQAVALHVEADCTVIKNCRILGNQDTLYTATGNSRQYYRDCYVEGTTDFIFGEATAVFDNCTIKSLSNSYITAAATPAGRSFGFVFINCRLIADTAVTKVYLGRPWRPYAKTVFIHTEMGGHIVPDGWNPWKGDAMFPDKEKTTFYAEYQCTGPGANTEKRVSWAKQLSAKAYKHYTLKNIFGQTAWLPGY
ncbi:pectin esterase (plasmid) [Pedobacter sp. BS3]|uniref:pectinesterase family protein n=1 Tax=Pedobacter sp. BS3 TaxID=2567937 RepID=UPI0011F03220|nr:pectinesterase family protein [Pedobacter sp. BS3]TZF86137.1 pectin esterase [Pedobacter sp. BS3]